MVLLFQLINCLYEQVYICMSMIVTYSLHLNSMRNFSCSLEIPDTFRKVNTFIVISWYILVFNESQTSHMETQSSKYHRCLTYIIHLNSDPNPDSSPYQGILIILLSKHILMPFLFSINLPDIMTFMNCSFIKFNSYLPVLKPQADTSFV